MAPRIGALLLRTMYTRAQGTPSRIEGDNTVTLWAAVDVWRRKLCEEGAVENHDRWRLLQTTIDTGEVVLKRLQGIVGTTKDRCSLVGSYVTPRFVQRVAKRMEERAVNTALCHLEPWQPMAENCSGHVHSIVGHIDDSVDRQLLVPVTRRVRCLKENVRQKKQAAVTAVRTIAGFPRRVLRAANPWARGQAAPQ